MRIVIGLKREANAQVIMNKLYKYTQMSVTFGVIMLSLVDGVPRILKFERHDGLFLKAQT
jgi:DNA gyrase subunit A